MFTCEFCLKEFTRKDNFQRHLRTVHVETENETDMSESDSDERTDSEEEQDPWDDLIADTFELCDTEYQKRVKEAGIPEEEARQRVFENMRKKYRDALANVLTDKVLWFNNLQKDPIYKTIKRTVSSLQADGEFDRQESFQYGIQKRKYILDKVLRQYEPPTLTKNQEIEQPKQDQAGGGAEIARVSPAQQTVEMARSMQERPFKKRKYEADENIYVIGRN